MSAKTGPIDSRSWETQLVAHAVEADDEGRRIFGYDVERDLAKHYRFTDVLYLSLTGELPDDAASRAFEIAMTFASAVSIAEAPVHASALARLCGVRPTGVLSVGLLAFGELSDALVARREAGGQGPLAEDLRAQTEAERGSVARLRDAVTGLVDVPLLSRDPSLDLAVLAVFEAAGLKGAFTLSCALSLARLPSVLGEAGRATPGDFKRYPIDTPHFEYDPSASRPEEP